MESLEDGQASPATPGPRPESASQGGAAGPAAAERAQSPEAKLAGEVKGLDITLREAIKTGALPTPSLMGYNDWQKWRAETKSLAACTKDQVKARSHRERELWKTTMEDLYGDTWKDQLVEAETMAGPDSEEEAPDLKS